MDRPLREIQTKTSAWVWDHAQQQNFEATKREIFKVPVLAKYDLKAAHRVTTDSSSYAMGVVLLQKMEEER